MASCWEKVLKRILFLQSRHLPFLTKKAPKSLQSSKTIAHTSFRSSKRRRRSKRSSIRESQRRDWLRKYRSNLSRQAKKRKSSAEKVMWHNLWRTTSWISLKSQLSKNLRSFRGSQFTSILFCLTKTSLTSLDSMSKTRGGDLVLFSDYFQFLRVIF